MTVQSGLEGPQKGPPTTPAKTEKANESSPKLFGFILINFALKVGLAVWMGG